jgi:MbtH protein
MSFDDEDMVFKVVINHEEQYSIWMDYKEIPTGWREVGIKGKKKECLDYIDKAWTDMRPLSLRKQMAGISERDQ